MVHVLSWERKPDSDIFRAKMPLLTLERRFDDDGLHILFPKGVEIVYRRITDDEARRLGGRGGN